MTKTSSSSKNLLLLGVGIAAGWLMKQLFDSPEVKDKREKIMASLDELQARLEDSDEAARIKQIFGSSSQEVTQKYRQIKNQLVSSLGDLHLSLEDIDKTKYQSIVSHIIKALSQEGTLPQDQIEKLKMALIDDFKKLQLTTKKTVKQTLAKK